MTADVPNLVLLVQVVAEKLAVLEFVCLHVSFDLDL